MTMTIRTISDVANAVRGRRLASGLSQADVARRAGVSRKWLYEFESGQPGAELRKVLALLDVLVLDLHIDARSERALTGADATDLDALLSEYDAD